MDYGEPTSYMAVPKGIPVLTADGAEIGTVRRVLQVQVKNIFDGIIVRTPAGDRFVDAPEVDRLYTRAVLTTLSAEEAATLPPPSSSLQDKAGRTARRTWRRMTGGFR